MPWSAFGRALSVVLSLALGAGPVLSGRHPAAALAQEGPAPAASTATSTEPVRVVGELEDERTATTKVFELSDGSRRTSVAELPVHFQDEDGAWQDIVTTLVPSDAAGTHEVAANDLAIELGTDASSTPVARITGEDFSLGIDLAGETEDVKVCLGNEATYLGVAPNASLSVEARPDGFKQNVIISSKDAPNSYSFDVSLDGLELKMAPGGVPMLYRPGHDEPAGDLGRLLVYDSAGEGTVGQVCTEAVTAVSAGPTGDPRITYTVPQAWLDDPARVFPVVVDPTATIYNVVSPLRDCPDTFVCAGNPTTSYGSQSYLSVGYGANKETYSFLKFDHSSVPSSAYIDAASLQVYQYTGATNLVRFGKVVGAWSESTTWNTKPSFTYIGSQTPASSAAWLTQGCTDVVRDWRTGAATDYGLSVYENYGETGNHRELRSGDYGTTTYRPRLVVDWHTPVASVSGHAPSYQIGDTVTTTMTVTSAVASSMQSMRMLINYKSGNPSRYRGYLGWFKTDPGSAWTRRQLTDGTYLAYHTGSQYGTDKIEPDLMNSRVTTTAGAKSVAFTFRISEAYGDVQDNDFDTYFTMDAGAGTHSSGWQSQDTNVDVTPLGVASVTAETTASAWHIETDANADGTPDPNDTAGEGRGSAALSWPAVSGASTYKVRLFDGATWREVATTSQTSWSSAGKGLFRNDSAIASLSAGANPFLAGTGRDLRDDPREMYRAVTGTDAPTTPQYHFKVVPVLPSGTAASDSSCATVSVTLDKRTLGINETPRHTTYELGQIRGHEAAVVLDRGALSLDVDDLSIESWGPRATLSRHYDSSNIATSAWAPGWTFNFEQHVDASGTVVDYVDPDGEPHRYVFDTATSTWIAPSGDRSTLASDGAGFKLTDEDRSVLRFDSTGRLTSEDDRNGNRVEYNWNQDHTELRIEAANGQEIVANFAADGRITDASYSVTDTRVPADNRERKIEYNYGNGYSPGSIQSVRWFPNSTVTQDPDYDPYTSPWNQTITYHYSPFTYSRLERIWDSHFVTQSAYGAQWDFAYESSGEISEVIWPGDDLGWPRYAEGNGRSATFAIGAFEATVTTRAEVDGAEHFVLQGYQWNPTGAEVSHTNRVEQLDANSPKWSYTYDALGGQTSEVSPEGKTTRSVFDARGNISCSVDGNGGVTTNVYDADDNLVRTTTPAGRTTYSSYDAYGNVSVEERVLTSAGERSRTEYTYDSQGRGILVSERRRISQGPDTWAQTDYVQSSIAPNGEAQTVVDRGVKLEASSSAIDLTKTKEYDDFGNLLWEKDATGQWTVKSNSHDVAGRLISSEDASATTSRTIYDKLGYVAESWREHGGQWSERKKSENTVDGQTYRETYLKHGAGGTVATDHVVEHVIDPAGNVVEQQTSAGTTEVQYNAQGLPTAQLDPGTSAESTATWDADGNLTASTQAGNTQTDETIYDDIGNVVEEDPADADPTTFDYDKDGNEIAVEGPTDLGGIAAAASVYDVGGRLISSADAKGFETTFSYDQLDRQLAATSGGVSATKAYNALGWVLSETDLDGQVKTFVYDEAGRVVAETLSGKMTTMVIDGLGRTVSTTKPDGSTVTYGYDDFGRSIAETHSSGTSQVVRAIERTFDDQGREVSVVDDVRGVTTIHSWNGEVQATSVRATGDTTVTLNFNDQGREDTLVSTNGTSTASRQVASRDAAGKVTTLSLDAGTALSQRFSYETSAGKTIGQEGAGLGSGGIDYEYNSHTARQTREAIDLAYPATGADRDRTFTYDDAGRLMSATDSGGAAVVSSYTPDGRIIVNGARNFTYRSEATRTQQLLSMVEAGKTTTYSFDSRGRRSGYVSQDESVTYTFNDDDRLVAFARDTGKNGSLDVTATYWYDGEGQRTRSVVTSDGVTTATDWTYEALTLLRSVSVTADETTTVEYVTDEAGRPVGAWVSVPGRASAELVWFVTDKRDDVLELLAADGTPLSYRAYSAYGETTSGASRAVGSITSTQAAAIDGAVRLRFASYAYDVDSGLYYCSQRYYDPVTCQWITRDPARADGEESAYQYCSGDPVGKADPSGLRYVSTGAVKYASMYYKRWNSRYRNEGKTDCANFVSQALHDSEGGGMYDTGYWRAWGKPKSKAWYKADGLYRYLRGWRGRVIGTYAGKTINNKKGYAFRAAIRPGDVVFYETNRDGKYDHTAIVVTSSSKAKTKVSHHSNGRGYFGVDWRISNTSYKYAVVRPRG